MGNFAEDLATMKATGWQQPFQMSGRAPIDKDSVKGTLAELRAWADAANTTAHPGKLVSVINDGVNNGVYFIETVKDESGAASILRKIEADAGSLFKVVSELPEQPDAGNEGKIHMVPISGAEGDNVYREYIWNDGSWEILGDMHVDVDLSDYATLEQVATVAGVVDVMNGEIESIKTVINLVTGTNNHGLEWNYDKGGLALKVGLGLSTNVQGAEEGSLSLNLNTETGLDYDESGRVSLRHGAGLNLSSGVLEVAVGGNVANALQFDESNDGGLAVLLNTEVDNNALMLDVRNRLSVQADIGLDINDDGGLHVKYQGSVDEEQVLKLATCEMDDKSVGLGILADVNFFDADVNQSGATVLSLKENCITEAELSEELKDVLLAEPKYDEVTGTLTI